ncbi:MAG: hypothetical protein JXR83_08300, partial [Deltaproteobacteria bacterium]|nr:hypothetical protein [Deltaproteobacteria bacterium]
MRQRARCAATAVFASAATAALAACTDGSSAHFGHVRTPDPQHVNWCTMEPDSVDPASMGLAASWDIMLQLFELLVAYGSNFEPLPGLAASWESSPDQRVFTFRLRPDARFSNGRRITSDDVRYSIVRVLYPLTAAPLAYAFWPIRHAKPFNAGIARLVVADEAPFKTGDVVELVKQEATLPDPNLRRAAQPIELRAWPDNTSAVFETLVAGSEVTLVDADANRGYAYVYRDGGEGRYGWLPIEALANPNADVRYPVASLDDTPSNRRTGTVRGADLLNTTAFVGVRMPDAETVVVELEKPFPMFFFLVAENVVILPSEVISRWPRSWTRPEHIVTSGPYHLTSWRQNDRLELQRSNTYWDQDRAAIERVTVLSTSGSAMSRYFYGDCDLVAPYVVPKPSMPLIFDEAGQPRTHDVTPWPMPSSLAIAFNTKRLPDRGMRRALALALDIGEVARIWPGFQVTGQWTPGKPVADLTADERALCGVDADISGSATILEPGKVCYVPPPPLGFHPDEARAELEAARGRGSVPAKLVYRTSSRPDDVKLAEWLANQWKSNLGLDVEIVTSEFKSYVAAPLEGADVTWEGRFMGPDPETQWLNIFRCDSGLNAIGVCLEEYDHLFARAEQLPDMKERLVLMRQAEELLQREVVIAPLGMPRAGFVLAKPYMKNVGWYAADWRIDENWQGEP